MSSEVIRSNQDMDHFLPLTAGSCKISSPWSNVMIPLTFANPSIQLGYIYSFHSGSMLHWKVLGQAGLKSGNGTSHILQMFLPGFWSFFAWQFLEILFQLYKLHQKVLGKSKKLPRHFLGQHDVIVTSYGNGAKCRLSQNEIPFTTRSGVFWMLAHTDTHMCHGQTLGYLYLDWGIYTSKRKHTTTTITI